MEVGKIRNIEVILNRLNNCQAENVDKIVDELLLAICDSLNISLSANPITSLLNDRTSLRQKEFISACLLRAISKKPDIFWGNKRASLRNKICQLFDNSLADIYTSLNINTRDGNDEKLSKLQELDKNFLDDFSKLCKSITDINSCKLVKPKFMNSLFGKPGNYFLASQFIDKSLIDKDIINNLFRILEDYLNVSAVELVVENHRKIVAYYTSYIEESIDKSSNLAVDCIGNLFRKILNVVQDDFNSRDELVPTEVEATFLDRKYPFHVKDREIIIGICATNKGKGKAFNVETSVEYDSSFIVVINPVIKLGSLEPGEVREFYFEAITQKSLQMIEPEIIFGEITWKNYSGESNIFEFDGELFPQDPHLAWEEIAKKKPYILEAVTEEKELIGRNELLKQLTSKLISNQLESSIIYGQKRVGKTSIAKTIQRKLANFNDYTVIYMLTGSLDKSTPEKFLNSLGEFIFEEISYDSKFESLKLPQLDFEGSITPLDKFFRFLRRTKPEYKFVIIIDEFDEIPNELYKITNIGDNFFHNIRSLSSENNIAFVLVGGENMKIIKQSTDKLNKFESFSVDYFDSERFWNDFQDLVRRPVAGAIEFTDEAIIDLYEATEGNPFFTKLICGHIYRHSCDTRNSYVSIEEVKEGINACLRSLDTNNVNHFWKDGISQTEPAEIDQIETHRRKFLIAYSDLVRSGKKVTKGQITNTDMLD